MPYTPERIAKIRQKVAQTPDSLMRDPHVDYYHGWFFVTLNTRDGVPVLSWCEGDVRAPEGHADAPRCVYSAVGKGVLEAWKRNEKVYPNVIVDMAEAMPEHFHGLIYLMPGNKKHLGHIIAGFMSGCSHAYWDTLGIDWHKDRYFEDARASVWQDQDRDHTMSFRGPALFVHGYNDVVPITPEQLDIKRAYIRDQAKKRLIQGDRHDCFVKHRHQHSRNWTTRRAMDAISTDRTFRHSPERCAAAQQKVLARLNADERGIGLDYVGNKALLFSENKLPLVCHSADAPLFERQRAAVIDAARQGIPIVSAFISQRERDIKQQLMVEQLPFIEIMDNGFSDKYKGTGKAFYALAENRLCQITPWTYLYQKDGMQVSREMCLVMNELARVVSGREDDWWKTPGIPGNA